MTVALPKVLGVETEYGILVRGADMDPISASTMVVNAHRELRATGWDHSTESPGNDARDAWEGAGEYPVVEDMMANRVLTNGARLYVDHAHPEYSTPECASPTETVAHDVAGERIMRAAAAAASGLLPDGVSISLLKNNSDGKGNSYGCHENYLVSRSVPFPEIARLMSVHLVTRMAFCGAGKIGGEHLHRGDPTFRVSQRSDFFEEPIGLETTIRRPVVNTRDEPHAEPGKYRRLHVIAGDANMSQWGTWMKLGTTALLLSALEDGAVPAWLTLTDPVRAMHTVGRDTTLSDTVSLADGRRMTALDLQESLLGIASDWFLRTGAETLGGDTASVLANWAEALRTLRADPFLLSDRVDWVAKLRLVRGYVNRHNCGWDDARLKAIDLQYHELDLSRSLAARAGLREVVAPEVTASAVLRPPASTRAYFRGECISRWPSEVVSANWDHIIMEEGGVEYRVDMPEPLRGTRAMVGGLLESCTTAAELLRRLGPSVVRARDMDPGW